MSKKKKQASMKDRWKTDEKLEKEENMLKLKALLTAVVNSQEYDNVEAKEYYDRLTKIQWKTNSLDLYEESLLREEFVAHNTVLTIFTEMDKETEERIVENAEAIEEIQDLFKNGVSGKQTIKKGGKNMEKNTDTNVLEEMNDKMTKNVSSKKDIQTMLNERKIAYKVRDTKDTLISLLMKAQATDRKNNEETPSYSQEEIGMKKNLETVPKEKVIEISDLVDQVIEMGTTRDLIVSVCKISDEVRKADKGGILVRKLAKLMERDFQVWMIKNKALIEEQNRKYEHIQKVRSSKKDETEETTTKSTKVTVDVIVENLKGKKLTEKILKDIPWRTLKKLAKDRKVKSFGKSREYIVKRLLKNKK